MAKKKFTKYPSDYVGAASKTSGAAMRKLKREIERKGREGSELLATDGEWELWTPKTFEGSSYLAKLYSKEKAIWDTAYEGDRYYWDRYNELGPLYIFVNKNTGEKYQSHPATNSWFYDIYDHSKGKQAFIDFINEHPAFAPFFDIDGDVNACDVMSSSDIYAESLASDNLGVKSLDYDTLRERLIENWWSGNGVDEVFWDWSGGEVDVDTFIDLVANTWHNNDSGNSFIEDVQNAIELAKKIGYDTSNVELDSYGSEDVECCGDINACGITASDNSDNWPSHEFWAAMDLDDDIDAFQDAQMDYLNDIECDVMQELGIDVIDAWGQSGYGGFLLGRNRAQVEVDSSEFMDDELELARRSNSAEDYRQLFRNYLNSLF